MLASPPPAGPGPVQSPYARLLAYTAVCWGLLAAWGLAVSGFDQDATGLWRSLVNTFVYVGIFGWPVMLLLALVLTLTAVACRPRPGPTGRRLWPDAARIRSRAWRIGAVLLIAGLIVLVVLEPGAAWRLLGALLPGL